MGAASAAFTSKTNSRRRWETRFLMAYFHCRLVARNAFSGIGNELSRLARRGNAGNAQIPAGSRRKDNRLGGVNQILLTRQRSAWPAASCIATTCAAIGA